MKNELQYVISGKSKVRNGDAIQKIASYLRTSKGTSNENQTNKSIKKQEEELICSYCEKFDFWVRDIDLALFVSSGAEQKVYLKDNYKVYKLNDAIYYVCWIDYFNNLLLNNYFFSDTAYLLSGFYVNENILYAVVEQDFVYSNQNTNIDSVKLFLENNGFENKKNNDYFNNELGIILEDLHDENVLTFNDNLYFIDTVFYLTETFYE